MLDFDKDLLVKNYRYKVVSFCANEEDWKKLSKLAKKWGAPFSASLLARIFIRRGLQESEAKEGVKKNKERK